MEQEQLRDGDYLIVEEGKLPPKVTQMSRVAWISCG